MICIFYEDMNGLGCHEWIDSDPFNVISVKSKNNKSNHIDIFNSNFECFLKADSYNNIFNRLKSNVSTLFSEQIKTDRFYLTECSLTNHGTFVQAEFKIKSQ